LRSQPQAREACFTPRILDLLSMSGTFKVVVDPEGRELFVGVKPDNPTLNDAVGKPASWPIPDRPDINDPGYRTTLRKRESG